MMDVINVKNTGEVLKISKNFLHLYRRLSGVLLKLGGTKTRIYNEY